MNRVLNASGGEERVTLIDTQMPSHRHSHTIHTPSDSTNFGLIGGDQGGLSGVIDVPSFTVGTGSTESHENMPPFYVLVYIIKTSNQFEYNGISVPSAPTITNSTYIPAGY